MSSVKQVLDKFYRDYNFKERILQDPIEFPHRYKRREDIEIAGFIASCFAYGKVGLFKPVIEKILSVMRGRPGRLVRTRADSPRRAEESSPYNFLMEFEAKKDGRLFSGINYRFNGNKDIVCLLYIISSLLRSHKSIENVFKSFYKKTDSDTGSALIGFMDYILKINTSDVYGKNLKPSGLLQFFPSPSKGSACKRMNLFLRWMIRNKDLDFGVWKGIPENKLIIPLDTHIARISRCLGFTSRKSDDWKTAVEITNALKKLDSDDPLKYDFAMCHYGISGLCSPKNGDGKCKDCLLK